jgi:heme oxygenase (mycobilin-producing)
MSIVKINAITVPPDKQARFEERFRGRGGHVEKTPGFEWFELLRPLEGTDQYLVYTRWSSEQAYRTWEQGQDFARSHDGGGDDLAPAASDSHHLWSYEVLESTGPKQHEQSGA